MVRALDRRSELPHEFTSIRDSLQAKQRAEPIRKARKGPQPRVVPVEQMGCDYIFDIPVQTAQSLTGYCHYRDIAGAAERPYEYWRGPRPHNRSAAFGRDYLAEGMRHSARPAGSKPAKQQVGNLRYGVVLECVPRRV